MILLAIYFSDLAENSSHAVCGLAACVKDDCDDVSQPGRAAYLQLLLLKSSEERRVIFFGGDSTSRYFKRGCVLTHISLLKVT